MTDLSTRAAIPDRRRGACPTLSAPMATGDGLLARVALRDAITPAQLAALAHLAQTHGNGLLDVSARGNIQVRGLSEASARALDKDLRALGLPLGEGIAVEIPPFAGLDGSELADPRPLAEAIRRDAAGIAGLAPKISIVVDGHGLLPLCGLLADIRLVPERTSAGMRWKILVGGPETEGRILGILPERESVATVLDLLRKLATLGPKARGRDLGLGLAANGTAPPSVAPLGIFPLSGNLRAAGIGLPFGRVPADDLATLCQEAERLGATAVKPAFDHALLFFGPDDACLTLSGFADQHGFVTSAADPRSHIAACPGSPACASAAMPTHGIAAQAAAQWGSLLDGSFKLHVAGCAKGCAHPQASPLTLCGTAAGLSVIHHGKAGDPPLASLSSSASHAALDNLSDFVRQERKAGETTASCLARLGPARLAAAIGKP